MNKTVTANISGVIFNIEEDAYKMLEEYLQAIRRSLKGTEGAEDILADVEARIAELFSSMAIGNDKVITIEEVESVKSKLGHPEDFAEGAEEEEKEDQKAEEKNSKQQKRVFRDPDNQVLGGVCSGLSHYFGWEPLWLRLAFVIATLAFGTGPFIYIILWIIIPVAKTTAEKLEMKGEPVTLDNIKKKAEKEAEHVKATFEGLRDSEKTKEFEKKTRSAFQKVVDLFVQLFYFLIKAFGKFFGVIFLLIGISFAMTAIAFLLIPGDFLFFENAGNEVSLSFHQLSMLFFPSDFTPLLAWTGILLVLGMTAVGIIHGGIQLLFNLKAKTKWLGVTTAILWITGLLICTYSGIQLTKDYAYEEGTEETIKLNGITADTLSLSTLPQKDRSFLNFRDKDDLSIKIGHSELAALREDKLWFSRPTLDVKHTMDDRFSLEIRKSARGKSNESALEKSRAINYTYKTDSTGIQLSTLYTSPKENAFRCQKVDMTLYVPNGKAVYFGPDTDKVIYDVENASDTHDREMVGKVWVMEGEELRRGSE